MSSGVTVIIPTIPERTHPRHGRAPLLQSALLSVQRQTVPADRVIVHQDDAREGAALARQHALQDVDTEWVAFLDDDDYLYEHHLETLLSLVNSGDGADYAYSWYSGDQGPDQRLRGKQMNPLEPHPTCITVLVRTKIAREAGFTPSKDPAALMGGEDWRFQLGCIGLGARFIGTGEITWHYRRHPGKTGGMPHRRTY